MTTNWRDYLNSSIALLISTMVSVLMWHFASHITKDHPVAYQAAIGIAAILFGFGMTCVCQAFILIKYFPLTSGTYTMNSPVFIYWKLYTVLYYFGCGALKPFTIMFLRPFIQKLYGARIGRNIALGGTLVDPYLIEIGDEAIIGEGSILAAHAIIPGTIMLAPIKIATRATVGVNAVVMPGVTINEGAILLAGAVAAPNTVIPANEVWGGIPAHPLRSTQIT